MKSAAAILLTLGFALGAGLWWAFGGLSQERSDATRSGARERTPAEGLDRKGSELDRERARNRRELQSLNDELGELRDRIERAEHATGARAVEPPSENAAPRAVPDGTKRLERAQRLQASFELAHAQEAVDTEWSGEQKLRLQAVFDRVADAYSLQQLDCRTNFCRVVLESGAMRDPLAIGDVLEGPEFAGGSYFHPGTTPGTIVAYVFRTERYGEVQRVVRSAYRQKSG